MQSHVVYVVGFLYSSCLLRHGGDGLPETTVELHEQHLKAGELGPVGVVNSDIEVPRGLAQSAFAGQRQLFWPLDVRSELYGMGMHSSAHLYAVPVLYGFDAIRNCSHCRRHTDDNCKAWREARKAVAVLRQEARRYAKGVDELLAATGGRTATIYEFPCGSVAYLAPDAPDFAEAAELKGEVLVEAQRILDERGLPGVNSVRLGRADK